MFLACYLLTPIETKKHMRLSYVGFTVSPKRRIRQHNGELVQGAKKTFKHRPWEMVLVVHGFPTKELALQFEWLWQHPYNSRFTKPTMGHLKTDKSLGPMRSIQRKVRELHLVLNLPPWSDLSLTLSYTSHDLLEWSRTLQTFQLPACMRIVCTPLDDFPASSSTADDEHHDDTPSSSLPEPASVDCDECAQSIACRREPTLRCYRDCPMKAHVSCLSKRFLAQDNGVLGIPHIGTCPVCLGDLTWSRLLTEAVNPLPDDLDDQPLAESLRTRRRNPQPQLPAPSTAPIPILVPPVDAAAIADQHQHAVDALEDSMQVSVGHGAMAAPPSAVVPTRGQVLACHDVVDLVSDDESDRDEAISTPVSDVRDTVDLTC